MKKLFTATRIRTIAIAMVYAWMMALGIGIAAACDVSESIDQNGFAGQSAHTAAKYPEHHSSSAADDACLQVRIAEQATMVKAKPASGEALGIDSAIVLVHTSWLDWSAHRGPQLLSRCLPRWLEPPVSIRFSRLTI